MKKRIEEDDVIYTIDKNSGDFFLGCRIFLPYFIA